MPDLFVPRSHRTWSWTLNNYTDAHVDMLSAVTAEETFWMLWGKETGAEGTDHLQGIIRFKNPVRFNTVKDLFAEFAGARPHIEAAKDAKALVTYCSKDGDVTEAGNPAYKILGKRGARTDLGAIVQAAKAGRTVREGMEEGLISNYQQYKWFQACREAYMEPQKRSIKFMWLWGETGCGKTHHANDFMREELGDRPMAVKTDHDKYIAYDAERGFIWDELSHTEGNVLSTILGIGGGMPYVMRKMHGHVACYIKYFIITSHYHPYHYLRESGQAERWPELARRLNRGVWQCNSSTDWEALSGIWHSADGIPVPEAPPAALVPGPFSAASGSASATVPRA